MKNELYDFYCNHVANWLSGGELVNRANLSSLGIRPLFDRIVTKKSVKKVICINSIPTDFQLVLSHVLNDLVFSVHSDCKVYVNMYNKHIKMDVNNDIFKRQMSATERAYGQYREVFEGLTDTEKITGKKLVLDGQRGLKMNVSQKDIIRAKQNFESYAYVYKRNSEGGGFYNTYMFIELIAPNQKKMIDIRNKVITFLRTKEIVFSEMSANTSYFLDNFSPASYLKEEKNSKEFSFNLFSDENIASLLPYKTHGFIGDGTGNLFGVDMGSKEPLIINMFEAGARQIGLICASAGYGKTILSFLLTIFFCGQDIHSSVVDVKGDEWTKLLNIIKGIKVDISETSNTYVNTLNLSDVECSIEDAPTFYDMSLTATMNLMKIIISPRPEDELDCEALLVKSIEKIFSIAGVRKDSPKTFIKSKGLEYKDIIDSLEELRKSPSYYTYNELIDVMKNRMSAKILNSSIFRGKEITVSDIIKSPLVVYTLDKNKNSMSSSDDAIRVFMISYLDMKKISIRKSQKLGTVCFYEELQRKAEFASLLKFITGVVTGARSSNVVVFILCNSVDIFEDRDMRAIASNFSTYILGPVENKNDFETLEKFNCEELMPLLKKISANPTKHRNQFAIKFDTGKTVGHTIFKCVVPDNLLKELSTRDVLQ